MHEIEFKDFIKLQRGFDLPEHSRVNGDVPVVASTSITSFHNVSKVKAPGVVTGRSGALGEVQYIDMDFWPLNTTLWVKDFKNNNPKYVYYFLKTLNLKRFNSGAGVPTLNRNDLDTLKIKIHREPEQKIIAKILSNYDDLIENNNKRIKILEEMAQKIYKEWFIDFKFPGHETTTFKDSELGKIPSNWAVKKIKDVLDLIKDATHAGEHLKNLRYVPIDCIPRKSFYLSTSENYKNAQSSLLLFKRSDILFGNMRSYFHKVIVAPFDGVTRTTCFVLRPKSDILFSWAYLTMFQNNTVSYSAQHSKGATIPYAFWEGGLSDMKIVHPSLDILDKFNSIVEPMLNFIQESYFKLENLRQTRDILLPRLISGEINVDSMEIK